MAEFNITCPVCGEDVTVDSDWAGAEVDCPFCSNPFIVPELEEEAEAEEAAEAPPQQPAPQQPQFPPGFDPSVFEYKPPKMPLTKSIVGAGLTLGSFFFYFIFNWIYLCAFGVLLAISGMVVSYGVIETLKDKKGLSKETILNTKICSWCALLLALFVPVLSVYRINYANENTPKEEKSFMGFIYAGLGLEYVDPEKSPSTSYSMPAHPGMPGAPVPPPGAPVPPPGAPVPPPGAPVPPPGAPVPPPGAPVPPPGAPVPPPPGK